MDVRVWNHLAERYKGKTVASVHRDQEKEKNRMYKARIEEYENGRFLPVVFNTAGSASPGAELFMKALARHIEASGAMSYATAMAFMRARVTLILARSASECLRGTHEKKDRTEFIRAQDFARRRGCQQSAPMYRRADLGAIEDMLWLANPSIDEEETPIEEACPRPPALGPGPPEDEPPPLLDLALDAGDEPPPLPELVLTGVPMTEWDVERSFRPPPRIAPPTPLDDDFLPVDGYNPGDTTPEERCSECGGLGHEAVDCEWYGAPEPLAHASLPPVDVSDPADLCEVCGRVVANGCRCTGDAAPSAPETRQSHRPALFPAGLTSPSTGQSVTAPPFPSPPQHLPPTSPQQSTSPPLPKSAADNLGGAPEGAEHGCGSVAGPHGSPSPTPVYVREWFGRPSACPPRTPHPPTACRPSTALPPPGKSCPPRISHPPFTQVPPTTSPPQSLTPGRRGCLWLGVSSVGSGSRPAGRAERPLWAARNDRASWAAKDLFPVDSHEPGIWDPFDDRCLRPYPSEPAGGAGVFADGLEVGDCGASRAGPRPAWRV
jgi:hypothetical protein